MRALYISVFVVVIDQVTKLLAKGISIPFLKINIEGMHYGQSVDIFGSFFKLTFVENPGMAFGIEMGEASKLFLSIFSIAASVGILIYMLKLKESSSSVKTALALILGGAVGNLIDRVFYGVIFHYAPLFYGSVVDFFNMDFFDFTIFGRTYERWPIFNIADAAVTIGVVMLLIFHKSVEGEKEATETVDATEAESTEELVNPEIASEEVNSTETDDLVETDELITGEDGEDNNRKKI